MTNSHCDVACGRCTLHAAICVEFQGLEKLTSKCVVVVLGLFWRSAIDHYYGTAYGMDMGQALGLTVLPLYRNCCANLVIDHACCCR